MLPSQVTALGFMITFLLYRNKYKPVELDCDKVCCFGRGQIQMHRKKMKKTRSRMPMGTKKRLTFCEDFSIKDYWQSLLNWENDTWRIRLSTAWELSRSRLSLLCCYFQILFRKDWRIRVCRRYLSTVSRRLSTFLAWIRSELPEAVDGEHGSAIDQWRPPSDFILRVASHAVDNLCCFPSCIYLSTFIVTLVFHVL